MLRRYLVGILVGRENVDEFLPAVRDGETEDLGRLQISVEAGIFYGVATVISDYAVPEFALETAVDHPYFGEIRLERDILIVVVAEPSAEQLPVSCVAAEHHHVRAVFVNLVEHLGIFDIDYVRIVQAFPAFRVLATSEPDSLGNKAAQMVVTAFFELA